MTKYFPKILLAVSVLLLASPLFVLYGVIYPHSFGKITIVQIIAALGAPLALGILWTRRKEIFSKKIIFPWALAAFAAALILTIVFATSPFQALWGGAERSFGAFTLFHILAAYFIFIFSLASSARKNFLINVIIAIGAIASFLGIRESYLDNWGRAGGPLGNPIFFGGYLLFPFFFSIYKFLEEVKKRIFYAAALVIIFFGLITTGSRGATAGAALGAAIFGLVFFLQTKDKKKAAKFVGLFFLTTSVLFFILYQSGFRPVKSLVRRFKNISITEASANQRLILYKVAWNAFLAKPLLGWGHENYDFAYDRHYDPKMLSYGASESWSDRSHNAYLDALVMGGIVGFIAYISLYTATLLALYKGFKKGLIGRDEAAIFAGLIIAYATHTFFSFDTASTFLYFIFVAALISSYFLDDGKKYNSGINHGVFIFGIIFSLISIFINFRNLQTSKLMAKVMVLPPSAAEERLKFARASLAVKSPLVRDMRLRLGTIAFEDAARAPKEGAVKMLDFAVEQIEKNVRESPEDFAYRFTLGNLYLERGLLLGRESDLNKAEEVYASAENLSPGRQVLYFQWASAKFLKHDFGGAIPLLQKAVDADTSIGQPHWRLGIGHAYNGEVDKALKEWRRALWNNETPEIIYYVANTGDGDFKIDNLKFAPDIKKEREFVSNIALRERDFDIFRALIIIEIGSAVREAKGGLYAKLAVAELEAGNFYGARAALERAVQYDQSARAEAEMFLREIESREQSTN